MLYRQIDVKHFHAEYNGNKAEVLIREAKVIQGSLPKKQLKLVLAWAVMHEEELMENWNEIEKGTMQLKKIQPLQ